MAGVVVLGRLVDRHVVKDVTRRARRGVEGERDRVLGGVVEFAASESENLQAVVVVGVVRGRDHDAHTAALLGDDSDARRREVAEVDADGAAVSQSGQDCGSQLRRALAGVVPDEDVTREDARDRAAEAVGEVVRDLDGGSTANAIRAKVHGHDYRFEY